jgi:hypothetical protein
MSHESETVLKLLNFLARDMSRNPGRIIPLARTRIEEARSLTRSIDIRDDELLPEEVTL